MTLIYCEPNEEEHETNDYLTWERDGESFQCCTAHDPGDSDTIDGWFPKPKKGGRK